MLKEWSRRQAMKRVKPGDGRPLKRFRWWQPLSRGLYYLPLTTEDGRALLYAVDVSYVQQFATEDGKSKANLYLDGRHEAWSRMPAAFPVPGGVIEVAQSAFGLKRCHYVTDQGVEHQLRPDQSSAEGRRERFDAEHPALSRLVGFVSLVLLIVPALLVIPQLVELAFEIPPVAERFGTFTSPVQLSFWTNVALAVTAAVASTERALRLRYSWLDSVAQG